MVVSMVEVHALPLFSFFRSFNVRDLPFSYLPVISKRGRKTVCCSEINH